MKSAFKSRRANWAAIFFALLSVALAGLLVWALLFFKQPAAPTSSAGQDNNNTSAGDGPCIAGAKNTAPAGFKFYENADLGFKFAYPEIWGDVAIATTPAGGISGHYLQGSFTDNPNVSFGGNGADYVVAARGGMATDNPGFLGANGKYYTVQLWRLGTQGRSTTQDQNDIFPIEDDVTVKQACNTKALVSQHPLDEGADYAYDLARINLQPTNLYYGVNFIFKDPDEAVRADLNKLLATFQLLEGM